MLFPPTSAAYFLLRAFRVSISLSGTFPMAISTIIFASWAGSRRLCVPKPRPGRSGDEVRQGSRVT
jgi:hypothetical protein